MQSPEQPFLWVFQGVGLCPAHPPRSPSRLTSLTHGHCQHGQGSKGGETTPGVNQRPAGVSENRGSWQSQPWQESQAHLLQGQALWKARDSWLGLLSIAGLGVFFPQLFTHPCFPTWLCCGEAAGRACPAAPTHIIPKKMGQEAPRWLKGQSQVQSCATCHSSQDAGLEDTLQNTLNKK